MTCTATDIINNLIKASLTNTVSFNDIFISNLWFLQCLAAECFSIRFIWVKYKNLKQNFDLCVDIKCVQNQWKHFETVFCNLIPLILWQAIFYSVFIVSIWDVLLRKWKRIVILEERSQVSCYAQHWLLVPKV